MINLDFIAVDGDIDVRGGGRLLRNGNEVLDEKNGAEKLDLLNQIYPVGSLFICKTGTGSPASKYGGNWQCLAENVVLPLGNTAPLYKTNTYEVLRVYGYNGEQLTAWKPIGTGVDYEAVYWPNGGTPSGAAQVITTDVKAVNLAGSSNAISGVDVWQRIEEI